MGTRFRKSINLGGAKMNISKSGVGFSAGVKGARVTKTARGTTRKTFSIPGTGVSYVSESGKRSKQGLGKWIASAAVLGVLLGTLIAWPTRSNSEPVRSISQETASVLQTEATTEPTTEIAMEPATAVTRTYVLNTSSKKIHYPSCKSVKDIKESSKRIVEDTFENLRKSGYTACKNCKPR